MSKLGKTVNKILETLRQAKLREDKPAENLAFVELYEKTYENLRLVARAYLKNVNEDRVCITNAYEKIYKYVNSLSPDKDGYNWLCKIVQTCAYDLNKSHAPRIDVDEIANTLPDPASIDDYIEKRELHEAIKTLTLDEQKLVRYHFFLGLSMGATAKKMGVVKGTVFYRLQNIIEKLRQIFGDF